MLPASPPNRNAVLFILLLSILPCHGGKHSLWTTAEELAAIPAEGPVWKEVVAGANRLLPIPDVSDQNDNTNVEALAAAIVYARTGEENYRHRVEETLDFLLVVGRPAGTTLAWAREVGAYALAADLVGYRTEPFEQWLRDMAEDWRAEDGRTLLQMFKERPNNWGMHAFGSLCAIYAYLGEEDRLKEVRDHWIAGVTGPEPGFKWGDDKSWHADDKALLLINPAGAVKAGMDVDGVIPDDMRRGGAFQQPPVYTQYPWEAVQGMVMAARILERCKLPIWESGDRAIYRAVFCLQERMAAEFDEKWAASGDDTWVLPFLDEAYGTTWAQDQPRVWRAGKNAGWGYVTGAETVENPGSQAE